MSRALGRYELLRPLARGGMGEVYLARRRAAGVEKWLVVKRMRPERAGDARFLDLFMREARLSMSLAHQNIVPVFDFGRIDDQVFLAMERIEGKDLGSSLARAGAPLSPMLAAFIAAECCQALDYAHRRRGPDGALLGIVHRDVTPRNVLLSWSGEVKLTDFGIAALAGDESKSAVGTPAYMAPEQARGEPLDPRADVYAVGLVLREALSGQRARAGSDRESTLAAARTGTLEPWPDSVTSPLRAIADKATSVAPADRYADARAMLEDLDHFIVEERAAKKGEGPARQLASWLGSIWEEEREEGPIEEAIEGGHLVSFLDDGALDVVGTGTQRSMAATAADEGVAQAIVEPNPSSASQPAVAPPPVAPAAGQHAEMTAPAHASRRRWLVPVVIAVPAAAIAVVLVARQSDAPVTHEPPRVAAVTPPPTPDVKPPVAEVQPPVAEVKAPVTDIKPPTRDAKPPVDHPVVKRSVVAKAQGSAAPPPVTKHAVMINTQPSWSYFTVDSDPTKYTPDSKLLLAPGPHTLHFTGNQYFHVDKTVTIDVPDAEGFTKVVQLEETAPAP